MSETAVTPAVLTSPEDTGAYPDWAAVPVGLDAGVLGRLPDEAGVHRLAASRGTRR
jgi:hypothetical protein